MRAGHAQGVCAGGLRTGHAQGVCARVCVGGMRMSHAHPCASHPACPCRWVTPNRPLPECDLLPVWRI